MCFEGMLAGGPVLGQRAGLPRCHRGEEEDHGRTISGQPRSFPFKTAACFLTGKTHFLDNPSDDIIRAEVM